MVQSRKTIKIFIKLFYYFFYTVHLWRYKNYNDYSTVFERLRNDETNLNIKKNLSKLVRRRETQVCLSFTYWGEPQSRTESHIYEMRSYALKPGSLIEWGNYW